MYGWSRVKAPGVEMAILCSGEGEDARKGTYSNILHFIRIRRGVIPMEWNKGRVILTDFLSTSR
ncbi:MAG TPA: hypothetical protein VJV40_08315, partial [Thermodesulfobacteriota bacterium]|nr:hypothetical protein [Thermodesulfobacteriota bacterium]